MSTGKPRKPRKPKSVEEHEATAQARAKTRGRVVIPKASLSKLARALSAAKHKEAHRLLITSNGINHLVFVLGDPRSVGEVLVNAWVEGNKCKFSVEVDATEFLRELKKHSKRGDAFLWPVKMAKGGLTLRVGDNLADVGVAAEASDREPVKLSAENAPLRIDERTFDCMKWVSLAMSMDPTRFHLNGVLYDSETIVATDGHRLHLAQDVFPGSPLERKPGGILAGRALKSLLGALGALGKDADLYTCEKYAVVVMPNAVSENVPLRLQVTLPFIDSQFPPYQQVIPTKEEFRVTLGTVETREAFKRIAKSKTEDGVLFVSQRTSVVTAYKKGGTFDETIEIPALSVYGKPWALCVDPKYAAQALGGMNGSQCDVAHDGERGPMLLLDQEPKWQSTRLAVIMPRNQGDVLSGVSKHLGLSESQLKRTLKATPTVPEPGALRSYAHQSETAHGPAPAASKATKPKPTKPKPKPRHKQKTGQGNGAAAKLSAEIAAKRSAAAKKAWETRRKMAEARATGAQP